MNILFDIFTILVLFFIFNSGSFFCCAFSIADYEDAIPVTSMLIVLALYFIGLLFNLSFAFFTLFLIVFFLYAISFIKIIRSRDYYSFIKSFFSPIFYFYLSASFLLLFFNYGKMLASWDEFSHWGNAAKIMSLKELFVFEQNSKALFPSYPPAMTLYQYFFQKLSMVLAGKKTFDEWRLYYSYQIFVVQLFVPFLKKHSFKEIKSWFYICIIFFALPCFINQMYSKIYIEPFLSCLLGTGLAHISVNQKDNKLSKILIILTMAILPITKVTGILFSLVILAGILMNNPQYIYFKKRDIFFSLIGIVVPILLWQIELKINHIGEMGLHGSNSFSSIVTNFVVLFFTGDISYSDVNNIKITPFFVLLFIFISIFLLTDEKKKVKVLLFTLFSYLFYFLCICVSYISFFSAEEASELAGCPRYIGCGFLAGIIYIICITSFQMVKKGQRNGIKVSIMLIAFEIILTPWISSAKYLCRRSVVYSVSFREPYERVFELIQRFRPVPEKESKILVITSDDTGLDQIILNHTLMEYDVYTVNSKPKSMAWEYDFLVDMETQTVSDNR